jgi:hypothetical protein
VADTYVTLTVHCPGEKESLCSDMEPQSVLLAEGSAAKDPSTVVEPSVAERVQVPPVSTTPGTVAPTVRVRVEAVHWSKVTSGATEAGSAGGAGAGVVVAPGAAGPEADAGPEGSAVAGGVVLAPGEGSVVGAPLAAGVEGAAVGSSSPTTRAAQATIPPTTTIPATALHVMTEALFMSRSFRGRPCSAPRVNTIG